MQSLHRVVWKNGINCTHFGQLPLKVARGDLHNGKTMWSSIEKAADYLPKGDKSSQKSV